MPKEVRGRRRPRSSPLAGTVAILQKTGSRSQPMEGVVFAGQSSSRFLAGETKYFDTTFTANVDTAADWATAGVAMTSYVNADGSTVSAYTDKALIPSAVGSGYGQVVGTKYALKKIHVRGELYGTAAADQADVVPGTSVRVVLVHDTQPNGAQATGDLVFTDLGNARQCNFSFLAMGAGGNGRFRILKDKTYLLQPGLAGTDGASTNSVICSNGKFNFMYKPKKPINVRIKASGATPAIAQLTDSNIFLMAHASTAVNAPVIAGAARAYYVD